MGTIKNFKQFIGESEDMPIQFTTSTLGRTGEIELDDNGDNKHNGSEDHEDHEVGMAKNLLDDIIKNAQELKDKIGEDEKNLAGWIQDHISQSQNYINQANTGYHELTEAAHIDMAFAKKEAVKFKKGQYPYNDQDPDDLANAVIKHLGYKQAYYVVLPTMEPDMKEFVKYMKEHNIHSFLTEDDPEYGQYEYLYISNDEKKFKEFVQKYWEDDPDAEEGEKFTDEIKKYSK
jgi:hypothetical protein